MRSYVNGKKCICIEIERTKRIIVRVIMRVVYVGIGIMIGMYIAWVFLSFLRDRVAVGFMPSAILLFEMSLSGNVYLKFWDSGF